MVSQTETRAVVAVDFGATSDVAIAQALRLVRAGAIQELHAVYVLDPSQVPDFIDHPALVQENDVLERAPTHLKDRIADVAFAMGMSLDGLSTVVHARIGKPVEAIQQVAVDYDADLIIVGTHGRKGIDRWVLGSVSERLARTSRCAVWVARAKDYSGQKRTEQIEPPRDDAGPQLDESLQVELHRSTQRVSWSNVDNDGPTGFRTV